VLSGRTKICVHENGRELLLAQLGPGPLIGERAALEVSVRSAMVVALTAVEVDPEIVATRSQPRKRQEAADDGSSDDVSEGPPPQSLWPERKAAGPPSDGCTNRANVTVHFDACTESNCVCCA
jgi:hypothetical protein